LHLNFLIVLKYLLLSIDFVFSVAFEKYSIKILYSKQCKQQL